MRPYPLLIRVRQVFQQQTLPAFKELYNWIIRHPLISFLGSIASIVGLVLFLVSTGALPSNNGEDASSLEVRFADAAFCSVGLNASFRILKDRVAEVVVNYGSQKEFLPVVKSRIGDAAISVLEKYTSSYVRAHREEVSGHIMALANKAVSPMGHVVEHVSLSEIVCK